MTQILCAVSLAMAFMVTPAQSFAATITFDADVSPELKAQVEGDLEWFAAVEGVKASPLHEQIFGPLQGAGYSKWFSDRVHFFGVDGGGSAVAYVDSRWPDKVFVTDHYINDHYPQIARLMTLYHEARHTEVNHEMWPHADCPRGFRFRSIWTGARLARHAACDDNVYGSYASASVLVNNVAKFCANCTDKVKADARIYADDQLNRVIGDEAMQQIRADFSFQ